MSLGVGPGLMEDMPHVGPRAGAPVISLAPWAQTTEGSLYSLIIDENMTGRGSEKGPIEPLGKFGARLGLGPRPKLKVTQGRWCSEHVKGEAGGDLGGLWVSKAPTPGTQD